MLFAEVWSKSGPLFCASAALFQLFAMGRNLQSMRLHGKAKTPADLVFDLLELLTFELYNFVAILADDVIVMWMFGVIRIVELMIFAEIHFANQAALGQ
jgi:hypothetical protein